MSANMKEIKARIESIKNSKQITNAMNIVSSTKFKKFQKLTLESRDYSDTIYDAFYNMINCMESDNHILFSGKNKVNKVGIIVITSDRGLCGSFNSNTLKRMENMIKKFNKEGKEVSIISIGKKARDYCKNRNIDVDSEFIQLIPETMFDKAKIISEDIVDFYLNNMYDEVYLIYSKFISVINYSIKEVKILPFQKDNKKNSKEKKRIYTFEPDESSVLVEFIPKLLNIELYQALLENTASEHSARMTAMKHASDNANDMIDKLTLEYNRIRQSLITQELTEIVVGSEALR